MAEIRGAAGLVLRADVRGPSTGPKVLLLHGGGQTRHSWRGTQEVLAREGYCAIAYDARGHGQSEWSDSGDYSFETFANDLREVAGDGPGPVILIGASLGGLAAMIATTTPPEVNCSTLVLVDVVPRINPEGREKVLNFMAKHADGFGSLAELSQVVASYLPHRKTSGEAGLVRNVRIRDGRYYWHWDPAFLASRNARELDQFDLEQDLARVEFPILLVRGQLSDVVTERDAAHFLKAVPNAELLDVAGAAHMVAGDQNDIFSGGILSFLKRSKIPATD